MPAKRMIVVEDQLAQIRRGGLPVLFRKIGVGLRYALSALWAVPAVLLLRAMRPWVRARIGPVYAGRIGHFVLDAAIYLAQHSSDFGTGRVITLLWFKSNCNEQWARMVRRTLLAGDWVWYLIIFDELIPGRRVPSLPSTNGSRDIRGIVQRSSRMFKFARAEEALAKSWLAKRGWKEGEPFVCLLVRDSTYLSVHPLHANDSWSYHDYRDSDIDTYVEAVQALLDRGYWVIRMGTVMKKPLAVRHQRVIDYPFAQDQDDTLDIWLSANCAFFISTGTGIDAVPFAYAKSVLFVNFAPLGQLWSYANNTCVAKRCRWKATGRMLTAREQLEHTYLRSLDYERAGISLESLDAADITTAVLELEERVAGSRRDSPDDAARQRRFWDLFNEWPDFSKYHEYKHPESRIGAAWLRSMGDEYLGAPTYSRQPEGR